MRRLAYQLAALAAFPALVAGQPATGAKGGTNNMKPGEPCCGIVAVNTTTGMVTFRVLATGSTSTMCVADPSQVKAFKVGDKLDFKRAEPASATASAASAGGTTSCGSNVGRNEDTRPKDCVATNSAGQTIKIACPQGVPIKTSPR